MISLKLLLNFDIISSEELENAVDTKELMYNKAKAFVLERHKPKITQLQKGDHAGNYKTYVGTPRRSITATTYEGIIEKLFNYYLDQESVKKVSLRNGMEWEANFRETVKGTQRITIERAWDCINRSLPVEILDSPMDKLDTEQICDAIRARIINKNLTMASVRTILQWIHAAYRQGINKKIVTSDPIYGIKADYFAVLCSKNSKRDTEAWNDNYGETLPPETIKRIEDHLWDHIDDVTARAVLLNLYTGLRIGETPAIMKSDIDDKFIHIHRQQQRCPRNRETGEPQKFEIVNYTKNERGNSHGGRYVPLDLQPQIRNLIKICIEKSEGDYLFADKDGNPISKDSVRTYLRRHLEKLGIKTTKNHVFRKSLNSNVLIPNGFDSIERSMILGHSVRVNMENYTYQGQYKYREIMDKVSALVTQGDSKERGQKVIQFDIKKSRQSL